LNDGVVLAAGAVLWRRPADVVEIALVHRPKYDDWSLPKGKLLPGEHPVAAAVREVYEETGQRVALGRPLPTQRYIVDGRPKEVRYWAAEAGDDGGFVPSHEVDDLKWLPTLDACAQLTYPRDVDVVQAFAECAVSTWPVVLLRHTDAEERDIWAHPDNERPLTQVGLDQARRLPPLLAAYGVKRVVSSDARRCIDTVAPYCAQNGLPMQAQPLFSESGYEPAASAAAVRGLRAAAQPVVVCTHRPLLPELAAVLCEGSTVSPPGHELDPGAFWVLHLVGNVAGALEGHAP